MEHHLRTLLPLVSVLVFLVAAAPVISARDGGFVPGYAARVAGEVLAYHSPQPEVGSSLLVRSLDEGLFIEWDTAPVPTGQGGDRVTFVWLYAVDVDADRREFVLHADGEELLRFHNPQAVEVGERIVAGRGGAVLRLRGTWLDRYDALFGDAFLELPQGMCTPGKPVRLRVTGESAGTRTWYMTFQHPIASRAVLSPRSAVVRAEGGDYQPLVLDVVHLGEPVDAILETSFAGTRDFPLRLGGNRIELHHPVVTEPTDVEVRLRVGTSPLHELRQRIAPVRPWTVHMVQHSHTDIGYTRPQTDILPEHLRFIDFALDYCDRTDDYPDEAKFRWTCEASWPVREWLRSRPAAQIARLRRRVAEGRIEVTGMFANMSEVTDEASYPAFLAPVREIRAAGIDVTCAMQDDVNGIAWCLADHLPDIGVRYVSMGQHGHRALIPFDRPTAFWWESPAGKRVLAYRADHYMTGNFWGMHTGRIETVEEALLTYLANLEERGHPFDRIAVQYSGFMTDNSPPAVAPSDFVRAWNERFRWPRLRTSVVSDYLRYVEEHHADELPVHRAAWPDWWTDGFGSAARATAAARTTQDEMRAVEGLLAMAALTGIEVLPAFLTEAQAIRDSLIFYGEHTFGAAESISDPDCENSMVQWAEKSAYAWDAVKRSALLREKALGVFQATLARGEEPRIIVVNTLSTARSGYHEVYIDHDVLDPNEPFRIVDDRGEAVPARRVASRPDGTTWGLWLTDVPAFGSRTCRIEVGTPAPDAPTLVAREAGVLANRHYSLQVDPATGALSRLIELDAPGAPNLVDGDAEWQLGQLILESLGNRHQLEGFRLEDFARRSATDVKVGAAASGALWDTIEVTGQLAGAGGAMPFRVEYRLCHFAKRIDIHYSLRLAESTDPEAIYVAFPFALEGAEVSYETLGGIATPGKDLLPGTASDWQTVQGFATARAPGRQIVLACAEIPLMQFGGIQTGRYEDVARVERPHMYSWVTNNYWTTNFRASQRGELRWSYRLTSTHDARDSTGAYATRFGLDTRVPFLSRVLSGGGTAPSPDAGGPTLHTTGEGVILVAAQPAPDGRGALLLLREVNGRAATFAIESSDGPLTVLGANALGDEGAPVSQPVPFAPFEARFLLVRSAPRQARQGRD